MGFRAVNAAARDRNCHVSVFARTVKLTSP
jgi:hypothetical protein